MLRIPGRAAGADGVNVSLRQPLSGPNASTMLTHRSAECFMYVNVPACFPLHG